MVIVVADVENRREFQISNRLDHSGSLAHLSRVYTRPGQHVARQHVARTGNMWPSAYVALPGNVALV